MKAQSAFLISGQGGNDLLGNRKQTDDQKLVAGNLALVSLLDLAEGCTL